MVVLNVGLLFLNVGSHLYTFEKISTILDILYLFVCFVPSLASYHEKVMVALYFGRVRIRLGVVHFRFFRLFS